MLVLSRKLNESIVIHAGESDITIKVVELRRDKVRIGIEAPADVAIWREEIWLRIQAGEAQHREFQPPEGAARDPFLPDVDAIRSVP